MNRLASVDNFEGATRENVLLAVFKEKKRWSPSSFLLFYLTLTASMQQMAVKYRIYCEKEIIRARGLAHENEDILLALKVSFEFVAVRLCAG